MLDICLLKDDMKLTEKDKSIVLVMCDLLDKGTPETRIAKYLIERNLGSEQLNRFLIKLNLPIEWTSRIRWEYDNLKNDSVLRDGAQNMGKHLRKMVFGE